MSKTIVAPIERVKLLLQTQDSNPRIKSGEISRYTGIGNCFTRVAAEQGEAPLSPFPGRGHSCVEALGCLIWPSRRTPCTPGAGTTRPLSPT